MNEWKERLRAELASQGRDMKSVSLAAGLGETYVRDVLTRRGGGKIEHLRAIARALGKSDNWLIESSPKGVAHPDSAERWFGHVDMPVYAMSDRGEGVFIMSSEPIEHIPRPYTLEAVENAYGTLITCEDMIPAFRPGDTAWVNPRLPPMRGMDAIFYSSDGANPQKVKLKHLVSWTDQEWIVEQWSPPEQSRLSRAEWPECHAVVGKFARR